jgi:hypothetical protein
LRVSAAQPCAVRCCSPGILASVHWARALAIEATPMQATRRPAVNDRIWPPGRKASRMMASRTFRERKNRLGNMNRRRRWRNAPTRSPQWHASIIKLLSRMERPKPPPNGRNNQGSARNRRVTRAADRAAARPNTRCPGRDHAARGAVDALVAARSRPADALFPPCPDGLIGTAVIGVLTRTTVSHLRNFPRCTCLTVN